MTYRELVEKHGSISAAARALEMPKGTFYGRLRREGGAPSHGSPRSSKPVSGLTTEQLLLKHSAEHQIRHAAHQLEEGIYFMETDFIRRAGIGGPYRHIVDREEFTQYRGKASGGVVYWGHPKSIAALKKDGTLR